MEQQVLQAQQAQRALRTGQQAPREIRAPQVPQELRVDQLVI